MSFFVGLTKDMTYDEIRTHYKNIKFKKLKKEKRFNSKRATLPSYQCRKKGCSWCSRNRLYKNLKRIEQTKFDLHELKSTL